MEAESGPGLSVVVPVYNGERTVSDCLAALLDQSVPRGTYEVLVVDDGSSDATPRVVQRHPVRYLHQENRGPAAARNLGVQHASGDIVLFTDADCVASREWIEAMARPFEDRSVTAVKGAYRTRQRSLVARLVQIEFEERYRLLRRHQQIDFVDTHAAAFRKEAFVAAGGFETTFREANNEDAELSYRLAGTGHRMVFAPDAIVYHEHPDSVPRYARQKLGRGYWRVEAYRRHPGKAVRDTYTPQLLKVQVLLAGLLCVSLALLPVLGRTGFPATAALAALFLCSCLPFWLLALRRDTGAGLLAPGFLAVRAVAIGAGVLWGLLARPRRPPEAD